MKCAADHTRSYKNGIVKIRSGEFCKKFEDARNLVETCDSGRSLIGSGHVLSKR
jgi:hypothetical protein